MSLPKIIFLDLDGTILDDNKNISERTKKVLKKLDKKGIPIILTSGRMPQGVIPFKEELGLNRPIIAFGGGLVLDENGEVLLNQGLTYEQAKRVDEFVKENNLKTSFNFYTNNNWYTNNKEHPMEQKEINIIGFEPTKTGFDDVISKDSVIAKCLFTGYEEEIDALKPLALEAFPDLKVLKTQFFILEIMNKEVSKESGIRKVLDYYGLKQEDTIGFGDSLNDLEMLDFVKTPVVMINSDKELLDGERYIISENDNNNDGVARFLEELYDLDE